MQASTNKYFLVTLSMISYCLATAPHASVAKNISCFQAYNVLIVQGANSTQGYNTVQCHGPAVPQANQFGAINCFHMPLLKQQDVSSELQGHVQGTYTFSQLTGGLVTFIVNSTSLPNKGSFSAIGIEHIGKVTSKPITGGTDHYRLVIGDAIITPLGGPTIDKFGNNVFWFQYNFAFAS